MPRYLVERTFPSGLHIPCTADGAQACLNVVDRNAEKAVTWVQSFVSSDKQKTFCIYDAPDPATVHVAAERNGLPVDKVTEIRILDPYFYF
jgi:hypothetical protein